MISKLMIGGNIFGHFCDEKSSRQIIDAASERGLNAIDTANVYSEGLSEEFIGRALGSRRDDWFIATKVGLRSHANPAGIGARKNILNSLEGSLKRLRTDYIDLYQIHHFDPETPIEETLDCFRELKEKGLIKQFGVSNYSSSQLNHAIAASDRLISTHQVPMNICIGEKQAIGKSQCKILAYSILYRGLLSEKYLGDELPTASRASVSASVRSDMTPGFLKTLSQMARVCLDNDLTIGAVALHWVLEKHYVDWAIVGCRSTNQLIEICDAAIRSIPKKVLRDCERLWMS